jgi:tetratricopeptide (TPR) repeat protein
LHEDVGHTLEELFGERAEALEAQLERLAYHFYQAAVWPQAFEYARRAGEKALTLYAPHVAIEQFTRALEAAGQLSMQPPPMLYRMRGQAFDTLGDFDQARADYEAALGAAQLAGDKQTAWQALLDLGLLWASRDCERTGDYCRQALDLARTMEDSTAIGHSLNRLGNWLMNTGQPLEALDYHHEALDLFETLDDRAGIAATLDLLAMTSNLVGDGTNSVSYYERAIPILRELNDRQTLAGSLTMLSFYTLDEAAAREAIELAREIDWRAGEAYALLHLGDLLAYRGDYGRGLSTAKTGLELAEAIDHRLWRAWGHIMLGIIYLELLVPEDAYHHLTTSRAIAMDVGSSFMTGFSTGMLASACLVLGRPDEAAALLPERLPEFPSPEAVAVLKAIVELALARQDPKQVLHLYDVFGVPEQVNWIGAMAYHYGSVAQLRAESLMRLNRPDEAVAVLQSVLQKYEAAGVRMGRWRVQLALGELYQARLEPDRAEAAFAAARSLIEELAATVPDDELLQNHFHQRAMAMIP